MQFAKAMILHHEGAVEMARAYHANPDARNGFLGLMNVDITTDQTQEIALMRRVIAAYPGDAASVRVDPSMVHGMEGCGTAATAAATPDIPRQRRRCRPRLRPPRPGRAAAGVGRQGRPAAGGKRAPGRSGASRPRALIGQSGPAARAGSAAGPGPAATNGG